MRWRGRAVHLRWANPLRTPRSAWSRRLRSEVAESDALGESDVQLLRRLAPLAAEVDARFVLELAPEGELVLRLVPI
jgi:hypothetical protein